MQRHGVGEPLIRPDTTGTAPNSPSPGIQDVIFTHSGAFHKSARPWVPACRVVAVECGPVPQEIL